MDASRGELTGMTLPNLVIAIATLAEKLPDLHADTFPISDGVTYKVFVQGIKGPINLNGAGLRLDIQLVALECRGVTRSRNAAINTQSSGILLFADDDQTFNEDSFSHLRRLFLSSPELDFTCAQLHDANCKPFKKYSKNMSRATRLNTAKVGAPELAIRIDRFRKFGVTFDTNFGTGSLLWLGDEFIFLCDAMRSGLKGRHINLVVGSHPQDSAGHQNNESSFEIRERVFRRALTPVSWPFRVAFACKSHKRFPSWKSLWKFLKP